MKNKKKSNFQSQCLKSAYNLLKMTWHKHYIIFKSVCSFQFLITYRILHVFRDVFSKQIYLQMMLNKCHLNEKLMQINTIGIHWKFSKKRTFEWFNSRVDFFVIFQMGSLWKSRLTSIAFVGFLPCVDPENENNELLNRLIIRNNSIVLRVVQILYRKPIRWSWKQIIFDYWFVFWTFLIVKCKYYFFFFVITTHKNFISQIIFAYK
jgi:hypothetical protein